MWPFPREPSYGGQCDCVTLKLYAYETVTLKDTYTTLQQQTNNKEKREDLSPIIVCECEYVNLIS
jgi:hypothetical protein